MSNSYASSIARYLLEIWYFFCLSRSIRTVLPHPMSPEFIPEVAPSENQDQPRLPAAADLHDFVSSPRKVQEHPGPSVSYTEASICETVYCTSRVRQLSILSSSVSLQASHIQTIPNRHLDKLSYQPHLQLISPTWHLSKRHHATSWAWA